MNFFEKANQWIENTESSIVNFVSAFAPWLAPIIPAFLTFKHTQTILGFPKPIAFIGALVIEFLGLATISTSTVFWKHNQRYSSKENQAPLWIALGTFVFYLIVILTVNVVLSWQVYNVEELVAITLLTSLSVPAAVTIAVRSQYAEIKKDISTRYKKKATAIVPKAKKSKAIAACKECGQEFEKETQKRANLALSAHMKKHVNERNQLEEKENLR